jgi:site-specific recombinase XerD
MTVYSKETKQGTRWYFQFIREGVYHRGGGCRTKREASDAEHSERNLLSPHPVMAFGEVCDRYLTWIKERGQCEKWVYEKTLFIKKHLKTWFHLPVEEISRELIERHILDRAERGTGRTANNDLKFIKSIFSFAMQMGYCSLHPCCGIQTLAAEERIKYIPPIEDFMKVYMVASPIEKRLLSLLFCTAARVNEILNLKWTDVTPSHLILRSRKHKGGDLRERRIPLNDVTKEALSFLGQKKEDFFVFVNPRQRDRYLRRPKLMRSLCRKAGVRPFGFHSIRHLATSVLVNQKEDLQTLRDLLGHAKITTTQIYVHSIEDSLSSATEKLGEIFNDHSTKYSGSVEKTPKNQGNGQ